MLLTDKFQMFRIKANLRYYHGISKRIKSWIMEKNSLHMLMITLLSIWVVEGLAFRELTKLKTYQNNRQENLII